MNDHKKVNILMMNKKLKIDEIVQIYIPIYIEIYFELKISLNA